MTPAAIKSQAASMLANIDRYVRDWLPDGTVQGREYVVLCPFHSERTPSFNVNLRTGQWTCRGCNVAGHDLIALYAKLNNMKNGEAAARLSDGVPSAPRSTPTPAPSKDDWEPVVGEEPAVAINLRHFKHGEPALTWKYFDADGMFVGWICRFEPGPKALPFCRCRYTGEPTPHYQPGREYWRWHSFAPPRPLLNLPLALMMRNAPILIVEGEKKSDAAARLLPNHVVVSWPGGCKAVTHSDFTPLIGRNVTIWPDADEPGIGAARRIKSVLPQARIVAPPDGVAPGWDLADAEAAGWTTERVLEHMEHAVLPNPEATPSREPNGHAVPPPAAPGAPAAATTAAADPDDSKPYTALGHNRATYYYMSSLTRQVVSLEAPSHSHLNMVMLAPRDHWGTYFPVKGGINWKFAAESAMTECHGVGIYDPNRIRGRGCWLDGGNIVFHAGTHLIINGQRQDITQYRSPGRFIYEQTAAMEFADTPPANACDAARLVEICEMLPWRHQISGMLLAGWCAVAPVCGVLPWRPHIWLSGSSQTGKTWTVNNIIKPLIGQFCLHIQGSSSEAGVRQSLRYDSPPTLFDEAESEDRDEQQKMRKVMELARVASTDSTGSIAKGSMSGEAVHFLIRTMFCWVSIGVAAVRVADVSRVTVLELVRLEEAESQPRFTEMNRQYDAVFTPAFADSIRARSISLAREIYMNARVLSRAVARVVRVSRVGDQIGAMLAGLHILTSSSVLSDAQAERWVRSLPDFSMFKQDTSEADEVQALNRLFDSHIKDGPHVRSIGELLELSFSHPANTSDVGSKAAAKATLMRHGIAVDEDSQSWFVSNSHQALAELFSDTPWAGKWKDQMLRVAGANQGQMRRFGASTHRCVRLPWNGEGMALS